MLSIYFYKHFDMQVKHMVHNVIIISINLFNFALSVYISTVCALLYISKTAMATSHFTLVLMCGRWALWFYCPTVVDLVRVYAIWLQLSGRNDTQSYEPDPTWRLLAYQYIKVCVISSAGTRDIPQSCTKPWIWPIPLQHDTAYHNFMQL